MISQVNTSVMATLLMTKRSKMLLMQKTKLSRTLVSVEVEMLEVK
jgi:hypothetical protein